MKPRGASCRDDHPERRGPNDDRRAAGKEGRTMLKDKETSQDESGQSDQTQTDESQQPERTFTQADVDRIVTDRLKGERKRHADELAKFADYDDLKGKAARLDEIEAKNKSELEKTLDELKAASKRADEAEARANALEDAREHAKLVAKIASEEGVPAALLHGADEDEIRASAKALNAYADTIRPKVPETKAGGATPAPDDKKKLSEREEYAFRAR